MNKWKRLGQGFLGVFVMLNAWMVLVTGFILFPGTVRITDELLMLEGQSQNWLFTIWPPWVLLVFVSVGVAIGFMGVLIMKRASDKAKEVGKGK